MKNDLNNNILTIDVEDWYMDVEFSSWKNFENRLIEPTHEILLKLKKNNVKATFFVLGYVADHYPDLIDQIQHDGHEIGTHGYRHVPITKMTNEFFIEDLKKSIYAIEKVTGEPVIGHRACQFTIMKETSWAIDIIKQSGLKYDSSIFPVQTPLYGVHDAPFFPYRISSNDITQENINSDFWEIPLSVYPTFLGNIPVAGGFYFRLFPYSIIHHLLKKINKLGRDIVFYLHPRELDPNFPIIQDLKWYNYYNRISTERKFEKLLNDFKFQNVKNWIDSHDERC